MSAPGPATSVTGVMTSAEAIAWVEAARGPEDLFGADAARAYRRLAQLTHPDTCPGDGRAARAFARLAALWRQHQDGNRASRLIFLSWSGPSGGATRARASSAGPT